MAQQWDKYAEDLRQEITDSFPDGEITFDGLKKLVKMESFLRESGRFNVSGLSRSFFVLILPYLYYTCTVNIS